MKPELHKNAVKPVHMSGRNVVGGSTGVAAMYTNHAHYIPYYAHLGTFGAFT